MIGGVEYLEGDEVGDEVCERACKVGGGGWRGCGGVGERKGEGVGEGERGGGRERGRGVLVATCMQWCRQPSGTQATTAGQPRPLLPLPAPWARA